MGRPVASEGGALHESVGSHSVQPCNPGLLPETACRREGQESCTRRLHAQAADHPQQHGEVRSALGSSNNYTLTHKTVALTPPFTSNEGSGILPTNQLSTLSKLGLLNTLVDYQSESYSTPFASRSFR